MRLLCHAAPACRHGYTFIITHESESVRVCSNHLAWGIRSLSAEEVTVAHVKHEYDSIGSASRVVEDTPIGDI